MCIRMYTYIYISLISLTVLSWSVRSNCSFLHGIYASSVAGGTFAFGGGSVLSKTGETCKPCENSSRIGNGKRKRRRILLRELYDLHSTDFFDHHPGSTGREREEREKREREREREIFLMTRETERLCPGQPRHRGGWDPFLSIAAMGTVTPLYSTTHPPLPLLTHTAGRRLRACAPRAATTVLAALTAPGLPREKFEFRSALQ